MNKYQRALNWFVHFVKEFSNKLPEGGLTSEGEDILKYYKKTLQELIDNSQQSNVQELIEKYEKLEGTELRYVQSFLFDLKSLQPQEPVKTLEELGYTHISTKDGIRVYLKMFRKGEEIIHIGDNGYKNKFGCEMGDCVPIKFTDEELEIINMME